MGITKFNIVAKGTTKKTSKGVKEIPGKAPEAYFDLPLATFAGTKIAIDGDWFAHKKRSAANATIALRHNPMMGPIPQEQVTQEWLRQAVSFVSALYYHNVTPVFVFDGPAPELKFKTQKARKDSTKKTQTEIEILEAEIQAYRENSAGSILDQPPKELIDRWKKKVSWHAVFSKQDVAVYRELLKSLGVPVLQSTTEGERLAAMLAVDGLVSAVFSRDTDVLIHGAPLVITDLTEGKSTWTCSCVRVDLIRRGFNMTQEELVDFAIAAECDYNDGIPTVGEAKIYPLMKAARFIENIPRINPKLDISQLNFLACRKLFEYRPAADLCKGKLVLEVNRQALSENYSWLEGQHLEGICHLVIQALEHLRPVEESSLRQLALEPGVKYHPRSQFVLV